MSTTPASPAEMMRLISEAFHDFSERVATLPDDSGVAACASRTAMATSSKAARLSEPAPGGVSGPYGRVFYPKPPETAAPAATVGGLDMTPARHHLVCTPPIKTTPDGRGEGETKGDTTDVVQVVDAADEVKCWKCGADIQKNKGWLKSSKGPHHLICPAAAERSAQAVDGAGDEAGRVAHTGGGIASAVSALPTTQDGASPALPTPAAGGEGVTIAAFIREQAEWSERTFGPGERTAGNIDHIRKELTEVEANPTDVTEWTDVATLALDGAWRVGHSPETIAAAMFAKLAKNKTRQWPDWRTHDKTKGVEHIREPTPRIEIDEGVKGLVEEWNEYKNQAEFDSVEIGDRLAAALTAKEAELRKLEQEFGEANQMLNIFEQQDEMHARAAVGWMEKYNVTKSRLTEAEAEVGRLKGRVAGFELANAMMPKGDAILAMKLGALPGDHIWQVIFKAAVRTEAAEASLKKIVEKAIIPPPFSRCRLCDAHLNIEYGKTHETDCPLATQSPATQSAAANTGDGK